MPLKVFLNLMKLLTEIATNLNKIKLASPGQLEHITFDPATSAAELNISIDGRSATHQAVRTSMI